MGESELKNKNDKKQRRWFLWLILITSLAIFLRSLPAWTNAAWGCDFGIYYGLTNSFVETKELFNTYNGWGSSYQYFPVLYAVTGVFHWITGLDILVVMPKIAPVFGGLSVLIFYFVVYELFKNKKTALYSSLFLAVMPFHVYQTSHASPLTMGHFFLMLSIYFFIKYRRNINFAVPLFISTILLIMSHHLTTYFYLISLTFIIFVENLYRNEWTETLKTDVVYHNVASLMVFLYWALIATPVYQRFMENGLSIGGLHLGSVFIITAYYVGFYSLLISVWLRRKHGRVLRGNLKLEINTKQRFLLTLTICLTFMIVFSFVKLPWTGFSFTPSSILYSLPLVFIFAFAAAGFKHLKFLPAGSFVKGWLLAIFLSFIYGLITNNHVLYPHRHLEYMMAPLSIYSICGLKDMFLDNDHFFPSWSVDKKFSSLKTQFFSFRNSRIIKKRQLGYIFAVITLVTTNAMSVYPSHEALNASYEGITENDLAAINWLKENVDHNQTVIASDHRLSRIAEASGFNTTLDNAINIWYTENLTDYIDELYGDENNYSRITHVIIDDIMFERVVHVGFEKIVYMTNNSYDKFHYQPFKLVYRNATVDDVTQLETHWTEIYEVNWTFIEQEVTDEKR